VLRLRRRAEILELELRTAELELRKAAVEEEVAALRRRSQSPSPLLASPRSPPHPDRQTSPPAGIATSDLTALLHLFQMQQQRAEERADARQREEREQRREDRREAEERSLALEARIASLTRTQPAGPVAATPTTGFTSNKSFAKFDPFSGEGG
jgi:hypothetical protein